MNTTISKFIIISIVATAFGTFSQGQKRPAREKLLETQLEEISQKLNLDEPTTGKFKTLYKQYISEIHHGSFKKDRKNGVTVTDSLTDEEVEKRILQQFEQAKQMIQIREKYYALFKTILSPKQIALVYETEKGTYKKIEREKMERRERRKKGN